MVAAFRWLLNFLELDLELLAILNSVMESLAQISCDKIVRGK